MGMAPVICTTNPEEARNLALPTKCCRRPFELGYSRPFRQNSVRVVRCRLGLESADCKIACEQCTTTYSELPPFRQLDLDYGVVLAAY